MTILQLDPQIPMSCPKGEGYALAMIDYSQDHDILWVIAINETGEIWTFPNHKIRALKNISMGRIVENKSLEVHAMLKKG